MDFILLPDNVDSHEIVPDLGGPDFDNEGFQGYDHRQGWNVKALREGDILKARNDWNEYSQTVLKDVAPADIPETGEGLINAVVGPFIQTWILFGIFQEALRRPVCRHEVSRTVSMTNPEGKMVSSKVITVRHLFQEFVNKQDELKADLPWATRLSRCLREAAWILLDLDRTWEILGGYIVPLPVHLALSVLVQTLDHYCIIFCRPHLEPSNAHVGGCRPLEMELVETYGWCPNMVRRVSTDLGLEGLYYARLIPSFGQGQNHDKCDDRVCVASNIDHDKYHPRHVERYCLCSEKGCTHTVEQCLCQQMPMSDVDLAAAFDGDGFPLVKFQGDRIEIVRYEQGMQYTAISHVWSDGRGNPHRNALPACQLKSIHQYVATLTQNTDTLFWIDTLCVPVKEPLRNTAIMRMALTYKAADQVLVLSEELLSHTLPSTSDQALFLIFCSKWMARLWTMQEAALAKDLRFQFANLPVRYNSLDDAIINANYNVSDQSRMIGSRANNGLNHVVEIHRSITNNEKFPVVGLWNGLRYRSTSRPLDVAICGSILLGSELGPVLSAPDDKKMQTFWGNQKKIPASVLWANGPRLRVDGFRWAPSNLLDPVTVAVPAVSNSPVAEVRDDGLHIDSVETVLIKSFDLPGDEAVVLRFSLQRACQKYFFVKENKVRNETWKEIKELWNGTAALLLPRMPNSSSGIWAALTMPTGLDEDLAGAGDQDKPVRARYLAQGMVFVEGGEYDQLMLKVTEGFDAESSAIKLSDVPVLDVLDSKHNKTSRQWCIF